MKRLTARRPRPEEAVASSNGGERVLLAPRAEAAARPPLRSRRLLQPVPLAGFALMLVGLLVVLGYSAAASRQTAVLVAARDLPAGAVLHRADLRSSRMGADRDVLAALVTARQEGTVVGRRLAVPVGEGAPLPRSAIAAGSAAPMAFTLAVPAAHALGGQLKPGDHVSVLATFSAPSGGATTQALARNLVVLSVGQPPTIGDPNQSTIPVTVSLRDPRVAARLALANSVAKIDLLRESQHSPSAEIPTASAPGGSSP